LPVSFDQLAIGKTYIRPYLAELWGYESYRAIARGVITPRYSNIIILFVTKIKQGSQTQYDDFIDGDLLFWQGEEKHGSDQRIIHAQENEDEIHLFYREIHHTHFIYMGKVFLQEHSLEENGPSEFIFSIGAEYEHADIFDDIEAEGNDLETLTVTEKKEVVRSRVGQGIFRKRLVQYWGSCSVTGLSRLSLLNASHIKPWKNSSNIERLDAFNGLLLTPNYDHLFDRGYISFKNNKEIILSSELKKEELQLLRIDSKAKLRKIEKNHGFFLEYHRDCVLKM
jgi:putative restriction endonuclease